MKVFNRAFTKKEKILILILVVILLALVYYRFVDQSVRSSLAAAESSIETNQSELEISNAQLARLNSMNKELDGYEAGGTSRLESYNNIKAELAMLDQILSSVSDYTISLQDPVQDGDLVRRSVSIRFTTGSFSDVYAVVRAFANSELRNVIQDINYSSSSNRDGDESVTVNMNVTFYETMVGGTPDAGLVIPVEAPTEVEEE